MRLVSCRVYNFGKLQKEEFQFDGRLKVVKEDNGWGKTTLAAFIASMFYGLPTLKLQLVSENDRRHYTPWRGGKFGGSLVFELDGRQYEVERIFYGSEESKGRDTFSLVECSTKRPVSRLGEKPVHAENLGEILFGIDKSGYMRSAYVPQGDTAFYTDKNLSGRIESGLNEKLRNLINATDGKNNYNSAMDNLRKAANLIETDRGRGRLNELNAMIRKLEDRIDECQACAAMAESGRERLGQYAGELERAGAAISGLEREADKQKGLEALREQRERYLGMKRDESETAAQIEKLKLFFKGQKTEEINLGDIEKAVAAAEEQERKTDALRLETMGEMARLENVESKNEAARERIKLIEEQRAAAESEKNKIAAETAALRKRQKRPGVLLVIACIFTLGLYFLFWKSGQKKLSGQIAVMEKRLAGYGEVLAGYSQKLESLAQCRESDGNLPELKARLDAGQALAENMRQRAEGLLDKFNCAEKELRSRLFEVRAAYEKFGGLNLDLQNTREKLAGFLRGKDESQLTAEIPDDISSERLKNEKRDMEKERDNLISEISRLKASIEKNEAEAGGLADYENEKAALCGRKLKMLSDRDVIRHTMDFLSRANDNLASEYLAPLKAKCAEFIKLFGADMAALDFTADSKVLIKEEDKDRELDYFSAGNQELVSLCMRFALLDIMFKDGAQRPCVILDDPFVNLDDKRLAAAKVFLKSMSEKYQIVYFTCCGGRAI